MNNALNHMDGTNNVDLAIFADYWQDFCPDGWLFRSHAGGGIFFIK